MEKGYTIYMESRHNNDSRDSEFPSDDELEGFDIFDVINSNFVLEVEDSIENRDYPPRKREALH